MQPVGTMWLFWKLFRKAHQLKKQQQTISFFSQSKNQLPFTQVWGTSFSQWCTGQLPSESMSCQASYFPQKNLCGDGCAAMILTGVCFSLAHYSVAETNINNHLLYTTTSKPLIELQNQAKPFLCLWGVKKQLLRANACTTVSGSLHWNPNLSCIVFCIENSALKMPCSMFCIEILLQGMKTVTIRLNRNMLNVPLMYWWVMYRDQADLQITASRESLGRPSRFHQHPKDTGKIRKWKHWHRWLGRGDKITVDIYRRKITIDL